MKRIATLTAEENKAWDFAFPYYLDEGHNDEEAARRAWKDLQAEFTRLLDFDGCRP